MDFVFAAALSQLHDRARNRMNAQSGQIRDASMKRRVRNGALGLGVLALAFYFGFIALLVLHSHH